MSAAELIERLRDLYSRPKSLEPRSVITDADRRTVGMAITELSAHATCIASLEARVAELTRENERLQRPDHYWPWDDPECGYNDPEEALEDTDMGAVIRCSTGKQLSDVWVTRKVLTVDQHGDWDDTEVVTFDNEEDAKRCWDDSINAARLTLKGAPHDRD